MSVYDDGDDNMKKMIGESMQKSRQEQMMPPSRLMGILRRSQKPTLQSRYTLDFLELVPCRKHLGIDDDVPGPGLGL
ncbi:MAG: hypothetical protein SGPRY_009918 [Prymnesium sp.]